MAPTRTAAQAHLAAATPAQQATPAQPKHPRSVTSDTGPCFGGTSLEMLGAMAVGMVATGAIFIQRHRAQDLGAGDRPVSDAGPVGDGRRDEHPDGGLDVVPRHGMAKRR